MYSYAPLLITGFIVFIVVGIIVFLLLQARKAKNIEKEFILQLERVSGIPDSEYRLQRELEKNSKDLISRWNKYWGRLLKYSGYINQELEDSQIGLLVVFVLLITYVLCFMIFKNPGIGLVPALLLLYIVPTMAKAKIKQKERIFDDQIPPFLAVLKANIQANETPERALINTIEQTNDPLYSEVVIAKALTEAGTFRSAITQLRKRTKNDSLKFLCSCIELSTQVGANLEEQIVVIESMLEVKRGLKRKLELAIQENKPLVVVTSMLIPGLFLYMYLTNEMTRDFWFVSPMSWIVFFIVVGVFAGSVYLTNRIIEKTANF